MLISSGWARGMGLAVPSGAATRPTGAKTRAAILNMLTSELAGSYFLDLFAGSGAMGLEAVSRGASGAMFVEQAAPALSCLKQNIAEMQRRAAAQELGRLQLDVQPVAVLTALSRWQMQPAAPSFDLVFIDPPYLEVTVVAPQLLQLLSKLTTQDATLILESAAADGAALLALVSPWTVVKQRAYGATMVTLFHKQ